MSTVTTYTLASQPAPPSCRARLPSSGEAVAFLSSGPCRNKHRRLSVSRALGEEMIPLHHTLPFALVHPVSPATGRQGWEIKEEDNRVRLWLQVPGMSKDDIEVKIDENVLVIKKKSNGRGDSAEHGVASLDARLLMTDDYDKGSVTAELKAGELEVTIGKTPEKMRKIIRVPVSPK